MGVPPGTPIPLIYSYFRDEITKKLIKDQIG